MSGRALPVLAVMVALGLALPAVASANWTHKGKGELAENAAVTLSGSLTVATSVGNVTCPTSIGATLTKSSSAGDVSSFTVSKPSECDVTGTLGTLCGTHGLTKVEKTGTWSLAAEAPNIKFSGINADYYFSGCLVPSFRIEGTSTLSLTKPSAISSVSFGGSQSLYNSAGESSGSGELTGSLSMSPASTYGVEQPMNPTKWTMNNSHVGENGELTLNGVLAFTNSNVGISCFMIAKLALFKGEVEEEAPEGEVKSFKIGGGVSTCDVSGEYGTLCGTHSVASVTKTGTWDVASDGEDVTISNIVLDYTLEKCAVTNLSLKGSATLTLNNAKTISTVTLGGEPKLYNASEVEIGAADLSGSPLAIPIDTYGVQEDPCVEGCCGACCEGCCGSCPPGHLSDSAGTVESGSWLVLKSTDLVTTFEGGLSVPCAEATFSGETIGSGEEISIFTGNGYAVGCKLEPYGIPMTVTSYEEEMGIGESFLSFAFGYDMIENEGCTFEGEVGANWTLLTNEIHVTGGSSTSTGKGCLFGGMPSLHGTFTATTTNEDPVVYLG